MNLYRPCLLFLLASASYSCAPEKERVTLPTTTDAQSEFEGRVPLGEDRFLYMELTLMEDPSGTEGKYLLKEFVEENNVATPFSDLRGLFSATLLTQDNELPDLQIHLHHSSIEKGVSRTYKVAGQRRIKTHMFRRSDLRLQSRGGERILVLDDEGNPVSTEPVHNLTRRTSGLFTVEGHLTHRGDTADFVEMNTAQRYQLSKAGQYDEAIRQYYLLRIGKFEPIYLKAVGFTVRGAGNDVQDVLVLKKLLQMTSAPEEVVE